MRLRNGRTYYGWVSILLHWIGAAGVLWLYFLGENIEYAREIALPREARRVFIDFHISIGLLFMIFLAARVFWRIAERQPDAPRQNKWLNRLALAVTWGFLGMIAVQIVTGPLIEWAALRPLRLFDLAAIPSPFARRVEWLHAGAEALHRAAPSLFWPLFGLHAAGALKHLLFGDAGVVRRMIWVRPEPKGRAVR